MNDTIESQLYYSLQKMGQSISAAGCLKNYLMLLERWNKVYNLTALNRPKDMLTRHILDSLAVQSWLHGSHILDVGTGAGLPGIPLAIINPDKNFSLLDSNAKKTRFLTQVCAELNLPNVNVVNCRIEQHHKPGHYSTIISRAFASLTDFVQHTATLCAENGRLLAMKGQYPQAELAELPASYRVIAVHKLKVPGLDAERHLVHVEHA